MTRRLASALGFAAFTFVSLHSAVWAATLLENGAEDFIAPQEISASEDRLLIVNGNSGRVIYDDGRNDLFCVTRRVIVGYHDDGRPIRKRTMRCR